MRWGYWFVVSLSLACRGPAPSQTEPVSSGAVTEPRVGSERTASAAESRATLDAAASRDFASASAGPIIEDLALDGHHPLLVWAPAGSAAAPVIVAAHGAGGAAEEQCWSAFRLAEGRAIVACLRGAPLFRQRPERGYYYADHRALGRELASAARALRQRFGARLVSGWTYVGFSQGATMGALALPESAVAFSVLVLVEGGDVAFSASGARRLREQGTERVLLACGTGSCIRAARSARDVLRQAHIAVEVEESEGAGHTYLGAVGASVRARRAWLWPGWTTRE